MTIKEVSERYQIPLEVLEEYMRLLLEEKDTEKRRIEMLDCHREMILDEIHFREKQIDRMDYLRFKLNKSKSDGK